MSTTRNGKRLPIGEKIMADYLAMGFTIERVSDTQCSVNFGSKTAIKCIGISRLYSGEMLCGLLKSVGALEPKFELPKTERASKISKRVQAAVLDSVRTLVKNLVASEVKPKTIKETLEASGIDEETADRLIKEAGGNE